MELNDQTQLCNYQGEGHFVSKEQLSAVSKSVADLGTFEEPQRGQSVCQENSRQSECVLGSKLNLVGSCKDYL